MSTFDPSTVSKYLFGSTTENSINLKREECATVLHSAKLALHLYPKTICAFSFMSAARLRQRIARAQTLLSFCPAVMQEIVNPDFASPDLEALRSISEYLKLLRLGASNTIVAGLIDAEKAYAKSMRTSLVRAGTGDLERTGAEAASDLFDVLGALTPICAEIDQIKNSLVSSYRAWDSLPRTEILSVVTQRAEDGIAQVQYYQSLNALSPIVAFLETRAAVAATAKVATNEKIEDPVVAYGDLLYDSAPSQVSTNTTPGPWDMTGLTAPWVLGVNSSNIELPFPGASGRAWILGKAIEEIVTYPSSCYAYFAITQSGITTYEKISLYAGGISIWDLATEINSALSPATVTAYVSGNRLLVVGAVTVDKITVLPSDGSSDIPIHALMGFESFQTSSAKNLLPSSALVYALNQQASGVTPSVTSDNRVSLTVSNPAWNSAITISGNAATKLGIVGQEASSTRIYLRDKTGSVSPASLSIEIGDSVAYGSVSGVVLGLDDGISASLVVPAVGGILEIRSASQVAASNLMTSLSSFSDSVAGLCSDLVTAMSSYAATKSQQDRLVAATKLDNFGVKLAELLVTCSASIPEDSNTLRARTILSSLEERGMDRATDMLLSGKFSEFWGLAPESASFSTSLMTAAEEVGRKDLAEPTLEDDILEPIGATTGIRVVDELGGDDG